MAEPPDDRDDGALPGRRRTPVPLWAAIILLAMLLAAVATGALHLGTPTLTP